MGRKETAGPSTTLRSGSTAGRDRRDDNFAYIDSHDLAAFSAQDKEFLEKCAAIVAALWNGLRPCLQGQNKSGSGFGNLG